MQSIIVGAIQCSICDTQKQLSVDILMESVRACKLSSLALAVSPNLRCSVVNHSACNHENYEHVLWNNLRDKEICSVFRRDNQISRECRCSPQLARCLEVKPWAWIIYFLCIYLKYRRWCWTIINNHYKNHNADWCH